MKSLGLISRRGKECLANERTTKFKTITHIGITEELYLVNKKKKKKKNALIMIWVDFNYLYTVS